MRGSCGRSGGFAHLGSFYGVKEGRTGSGRAGRDANLSKGQCLAAKRVVDLTWQTAIERGQSVERARRIRKPPRRMHAID